MTEPFDWPEGSVVEMGKSTVRIVEANGATVAYAKWSGASLAYTTTWDDKGKPTNWKDATVAYAAFPKWVREALTSRIAVKVGAA